MTKGTAFFSGLLVASVGIVVFIVVALASDEAQVPIKVPAPKWTWECNTETELCEKLEYNTSSTIPMLSWETCRIACGHTGRLWPAPTGKVNLTTLVARVSPSKFELIVENSPSDAVKSSVEAAYRVFEDRVKALLPQGHKPDESYVGIDVRVTVQSDVLKFSYETDESYSLTLVPGKDNDLVATVVADSFFGARHALETLFQLIAFDEYCSCYVMVSHAEIMDAPAYKHRGISMDTSRNYYPMADLRRIVDAMSMNKLNIFHWHITDTHSFPYVSKLRPEMSADGAYSDSQVYTMEDIKDFVEYARVRGVKVVPELDAPAHCGNGWRWGPAAGLGDLVWCANKEPWFQFCVEPPCGQLNPLNPNVFGILRDLYEEWSTIFDTDLIHLGGDELSKECWQTEPSVLEWVSVNASQFSDMDSQLVHLWWEAFEKRAEEELDAAYGHPGGTDVVLWTSGLTNRAATYLNKDKHIIQVWTEYNNTEIGNLARAGFRLIMSNYDKMYLDCGFQSWVGDGHNWCSPYKTWQGIHDNDPRKIISDLAPMSEAELDRIALGGEVALWSEQADPMNLDNRLWPRSAAHAERMWTKPDATQRSDKDVWRMQAQRSRMVQLGIRADALLPAWCQQNEGQCPRVSGKMVTVDQA